MQIFRLQNDEDEIVATVVEFDNGTVVTSWETTEEPQSIAVWRSLAEAKKIHVGKGRRNLVLVAAIA